MYRVGAALLLAGFALAVPVAAEPTGMPSEIEWKLAELGPVVNPPETAKLYAPLQEKEPYRGVRVTRDVKYGSDPRNALDIFESEEKVGTPRPVLIFVHGGGFVGGNKHVPGSPFYDNIVLFAARNGLVGVNVTYRLAPQNPWPAAAQDLAGAVRWVGENIAGHGGDPAHVVLMGHSAGAVHVATYVAHTEFHGPKGVGLSGAILLSGLYDLAAVPPGGTEVKYFGDDRSTYRERSSIAGLVATRLPLLVDSAELDPPIFQQQAQQLKEALCKTGRCPRFVSLAKHSHLSEVYAINTKDTTLSDQILAFVKAAR
jgi:acetyl esterase/lipase